MSEYYCEKHKYNPPQDSGIGFCPKCEGLPGTIGELEEMVNGKRKNGSELEVGDVFISMGRGRKLTRFAKHPGLGDSTARVAWCGDYGVTVFDDEQFRQTSDGGWIKTHQWFAYEQKLENS